MATAPNTAAVSGAVLHEERGSIVMPTNAASNQFIVQLKKRAKVAAQAQQAATAAGNTTSSTTSTTVTAPGRTAGG